MDDDVLTFVQSVAVTEDVFALRPDFLAVVVVVDGVRGGPSDGASRTLLGEASAGAAGIDPVAHPQVAAWRTAYSAFGAKPGRTRNSAEALLRRAEAGLPEINALVDTYNAISVRHRIPVGGEDLDAYVGAPRLVRAVGDERFETTADGRPADEHPEPGEVVWRDDAGVTCRRWNHRQCVRTRITEHTRRALFVLERLEPMPFVELVAAAEDLIDCLVARAPASTTSMPVGVRLLGRGCRGDVVDRAAGLSPPG